MAFVWYEQNLSRFIQACQTTLSLLELEQTSALVRFQGYHSDPDLKPAHA